MARQPARTARAISAVRPAPAVGSDSAALTKAQRGAVLRRRSARRHALSIAVFRRG